MAEKTFGKQKEKRSKTGSKAMAMADTIEIEEKYDSDSS